MENVSNLKIYGQGSSGGGKFKDVEIKGSGQISGDIECNKYEVYGNGESNVQGDIITDEASIQGSLNLKGDLNAEICKIDGGFDIDGLLNVEEFELSMHWPCKVSEIGGTTINIKNNTKFSFLGIKNMIKPHSNKRLLEVDTIEADEIHLENTNANIVRGKKITLGPDCKINKIEYQDSFTEHEKSNVESSEKI